MSTKHSSFIPMAPEHCPQQRLNEVVSVPPIHDKLKPKIDWLNPLQKRRPKGSPRKLSFLCSVEWAWSPMHNRIDNYYLNPRRDGWLLWINRLNDHTVPWTWWWDFVAYANKCKAEDELVANHLLIEYWKNEAEYQGLDEYHWINNTGLISVEEMHAIARKVW